MADFTKEDKKALYATKETVIKIETILSDPDVGLCRKVDDIKDNHASLSRDHNRLKLKVYVLIAFLCGLGILGGGGYALLQRIGG